MKNRNAQSTLSLTEIFILSPEIKRGLHLRAAIRYSELLIEICKELVKLGKGNTDPNADINAHLNDADKDRVEKCKEAQVSGEGEYPA